MRAGDRVTSPLLVGEWVVDQVMDDSWVDLIQYGIRVSVKGEKYLSPVGAA